MLHFFLIDYDEAILPSKLHISGLNREPE